MHFNERGQRHQLQRDDECQHHCDGELQPGGNYIDYRDAKYGNDWNAAAIYGDSARKRQLQHWRDLVAELCFMRELGLRHDQREWPLQHALSGAGVGDCYGYQHYGRVYERERQRDRDVERAGDGNRAGIERGRKYSWHAERESAHDQPVRLWDEWVRS